MSVSNARRNCTYSQRINQSRAGGTSGRWPRKGRRGETESLFLMLENAIQFIWSLGAEVQALQKDGVCEVLLQSKEGLPHWGIAPDTLRNPKRHFCLFIDENSHRTFRPRTSRSFKSFSAQPITRRSF